MGPYRLSVRTRASQARKRGSIPRRVMDKKKVSAVMRPFFLHDPKRANCFARAGESKSFVLFLRSFALKKSRRSTVHVMKDSP